MPMSDPSQPRPGEPPAATPPPGPPADLTPEPPPPGSPADLTPEPAPAVAPEVSPVSTPAPTETGVQPLTPDLGDPAGGGAPDEAGAGDPAAAADGTTLGDAELLDEDAAADEFDELGAYGDEDFVAGQEPSRWAGVLTTLGAGLVAVVLVQVVGALVEGLSLREGERISNEQIQVADDLFHRLGYPFFNLVTPSLIILLVAVGLLALPWITGHRRTPGQESIAGTALFVAMALGIVLALGSMLAVRASLHEYAVKDFRVPRFLRINYTTFLLVTLGTAALAVFAAVASILHGARRR